MTDDKSLREQVEQRLQEELARGTRNGVGLAMGPDTDPAKVAEYAKALAYLDLMERNAPPTPEQQRASEAWGVDSVWGVGPVTSEGYARILEVFTQEQDAQNRADHLATDTQSVYVIRRLPVYYKEKG